MVTVKLVPSSNWSIIRTWAFYMSMSFNNIVLGFKAINGNLPFVRLVGIKMERIHPLVLHLLFREIYIVISTEAMIIGGDYWLDMLNEFENEERSWNDWFFSFLFKFIQVRWTVILYRNILISIFRNILISTINEKWFFMSTV